MVDGLVATMDALWADATVAWLAAVLVVVMDALMDV